MNDDTRKLFERVAQKMGWAEEGGLDAAEKKVCCTLHSRYLHTVTGCFLTILFILF